jgi:pyruvate,water dikinase
MSRMVRASESLSRQFDGGVSGLLDRLRNGSDPDSVRFFSAFDSFLFEFGSRGSNEWDVCTVTWETNPDIPLALIERMRLQDDGQSPEVNAERLRVDRERQTERVRAQLSSTPKALAAFEQARGAAIAYIIARERNKTNAVRVLQEARLAFRELGLRMVARGHFGRWDDINMIREDELDALLQEPRRYGEIANERLGWADQLQHLSPPFVVYRHVPPPSTWEAKTAETAKPAAPGDQLQGLAACPGQATGRARVIKDPADAHQLGIGEVLVAPMTDPGWTPLFVSAAAIVVDVGSQLSHAAIVSRELGIPCVVGLSHASTRIPDGAMISVDGSAGTVTLL